ncbi:MAG: hypothetical protein Q9163_003371 [Psora crenata]
MAKSGSEASDDFEYIETPAAPSSTLPQEDCGIRTTTYPSIKNAPLPADSASSENFSNTLLCTLLILVPGYLARKVSGGFFTWAFFALFTSIPVLGTFWYVASSISPRKNEKVRYPGRPVEHYLHFKDEKDRARYHGKAKIPMETFYEMYFDGRVEFKGDALEVLEYRHDWANFRITLSLMRFFLTGMVPEVIMHSRSQDEEQVRGHYDRGDDFYGWFLGPRMIYTSGIISDINTEETLEQLQDNKLGIVCEKIGLKPGESMLDIGCGWGTLVKYASTNYGAHATGVTLGRNQTAWGNNALRKVGVAENQSKILCMDYRDMAVPKGGYNKITCLEMAEHVGLRHFHTFLTQIYDMLDDDGVFFLQIAGLRKCWQYEDLVWGLFMNKYIFPGADASTPLGWFVDKLEGAGFEVKSVDTIGVHYTATLWRWYRNWLANREKVEAKYGARWFRIWEYFLAYSTIISRQGSATCYQITLVKNINSTHRIEGVPSQFGLHGALAASKGAIAANMVRNVPVLQPKRLPLLEGIAFIDERSLISYQRCTDNTLPMNDANLITMEVSHNKVNILPSGGHEVEGLLRLTFPGHDGAVTYGSFPEDPNELRPSAVRLGTKASDLRPSCVGFRILLRNAQTISQAQGTQDELYHLISCRFRPKSGLISHHALTDTEADDLALAIGTSEHRVSRNVHRLDFSNLVDAFEITHHGDEPDMSQAGIAQILRNLKSLNGCRQLSLFFQADEVLLYHLDQAIERGCIGVIPQAWSESLPLTAVPTWPTNNQTRMVAGSADLVNVLNKAMREPILDDAPVTALNNRPRAQRFKAFTRKTYPSLKREPTHKLFPLMLNIRHGICVELPFGGSMFNRENTYATINALHKILESGLPPAHIGIVTFYPSQAKVYRDILALCHEYRPARGYIYVKVDVLDNWVGTEIGYAIVDLVRTSNASGNLGFLSQTRRIKVALTLHRDGLILVGDRQCIINAQGQVTSTKLEKVFRWLEENGRIIDVDEEGMPVSTTTSESKHIGTKVPSISPTLPPHSTSPKPAISPMSMAKRYVGIPELEYYQKAQSGTTLYDARTETSANMGGDSGGLGTMTLGMKYKAIPPSHKLGTSESFARQGLFATGLLPVGRNRRTETPSNLIAAPDNGQVLEKGKDTRQGTVEKIVESKKSSISELAGLQEHRIPAYQEYLSRGSPFPTPTTPVIAKENVMPQASNNESVPRRNTHVTLKEVADITDSPNDSSKKFSASGSAATQGIPLVGTAPSDRVKNAMNEPRTASHPTVPPSQSDKQSPSSTQPQSNSLPQAKLQTMSEPDFLNRYTPKYKAIRSIFDSLHSPTSPAATAKEDRLFRRLGEAFIGEDAKSFDVAYVELLRLAQGMHIGD